MDVFDRATELEEQHRERSLAAAMSHQPTGQSYSHCEDCGEPIPEKRRLTVLGCTRCVECQSDHEKRSAR